MAVSVSVDFVWSQPIQEVLKDLDEHSASILSWQTVGPAGGNPMLVLGFKTKSDALHFLMNRCPDDGIEFNESRIS